MKKFMVVIAMLALGLYVVACGGETTAPAEEPADEPAAEPAEEPAAEPAAEGDAGGPCEAYAACCTAYADALGGVEGIPAASVDATKQSCEAIEALKSLPTAADSCQQSFDALKQGMEAYKAMPGFEVPGACQ
jgi:hypothetical protein